MLHLTGIFLIVAGLLIIAASIYYMRKNNIKNEIVEYKALMKATSDSYEPPKHIERMYDKKPINSFVNTQKAKAEVLDNNDMLLAEEDFSSLGDVSGEDNTSIFEEEDTSLLDNENTSLLEEDTSLLDDESTSLLYDEETDEDTTILNEEESTTLLEEDELGFDYEELTSILNSEEETSVLSEEEYINA